MKRYSYTGSKVVTIGGKVVTPSHLSNLKKTTLEKLVEKKVIKEDAKENRKRSERTETTD